MLRAPKENRPLWGGQSKWVLSPADQPDLPKVAISAAITALLGGLFPA